MVKLAVQSANSYADPLRKLPPCGSPQRFRLRYSWQRKGFQPFAFTVSNALMAGFFGLVGEVLGYRFGDYRVSVCVYITQIG